jgi:hypothetical protein
VIAQSSPFNVRTNRNLLEMPRPSIGQEYVVDVKRVVAIFAKKQCVTCFLSLPLCIKLVVRADNASRFKEFYHCRVVTKWTGTIPYSV